MKMNAIKVVVELTEKDVIALRKLSEIDRITSIEKKILDAVDRTKIKKFKLHWLDGHTDIVEATSISDAFSKSGYGAGAIPALDYYEDYEEIEENKEELNK